MIVTPHAIKRIKQRVHRQPQIRSWFLRRVEELRGRRNTPDDTLVFVRMGRSHWFCVIRGGALVTVMPKNDPITRSVYR